MKPGQSSHPSNGPFTNTPEGNANIEELFRYHPPRPDQVGRYEHLRALAADLAGFIVANVPDCADKTAALRKLREAVMTANAAIALDPYTRPFDPPASK